MNRSTFVAAILAAVLLPVASLAQSDWPNRPVTFIVPYPPGGLNDAVARVFADRMIGFFFRNADRVRIKELEYQLAAEFLGAEIKYSGRPLAKVHAKHPIMGGQFARRRQIFKETLEQAGIPCTIRMRRGIDIQAGCGQLAGAS